MTKTDMTVSQTILEQLGGRRFLTMTGAKNLVGSNDSLSMQLPGMARCDGKKITGVRITLTPNDLYTVEAVRIQRKPTWELLVIGKAVDVYCDDLQTVFTSLTALETHL